MSQISDDVCNVDCYNDACMWDGDAKACYDDCQTDTINFPHGCIHPQCGGADEAGRNKKWCKWG